MGLDDKIKHVVQEGVGKVKELAGDATDDEDLEAKGKLDQAASKVKQAGEAWKDELKDKIEGAREAGSEKVGGWSDRIAEQADRLKDRAKRDD